MHTTQKTGVGAANNPEKYIRAYVRVASLRATHQWLLIIDCNFLSFGDARMDIQRMEQGPMRRLVSECMRERSLVNEAVHLRTRRRRRR